MSEEIELITSPLSRPFSQDGLTVEVEIYSSGRDDWQLEVVDHWGNSTVWEESFSTDELALAEFVNALESEGIHALIGPEPLNNN
ncbi:MAG: hypothetical protein ACI9R3_005955 [Verrucomicrobiales bacterium]|jgi:uncharacterized protein